MVSFNKLHASNDLMHSLPFVVLSSSNHMLEYLFLKQTIFSSYILFEREMDIKQKVDRL